MPNGRKITEFIDENAFNQFTKLKLELEGTQKQFAELIAKADSFNKVLGGSKSAEQMAETMSQTSAAMKDVSKSSEKLAADSKKVAEAEEKVTAATVENAKQYAHINGTLEQQIKEQIKLKAELKAVKDQTKAANKVAQESGTITKEQATIIERLAKEEAQLKQQIADTNRTVKQQVLGQQAAEGSSKQLAARLNEMKERYQSLSQAERQNEKVGGQLLAQIKSTDKQIKGLDESQGVYNRNVGNYRSALQGVGGSLGMLSPQLGMVSMAFTQAETTVSALTAATREYITGKNAQTAATEAGIVATKASSKSLKILRLALLSTGIGAIIVALGALIAYFASTQAGIDKVSAALAPLKAIFQSLLGVFQRVGEAMFDAFTHPQEAIKSLWESIKKNIVNRIEGLGEVFKALGKIIASGFTDGYKDLGNAVAKTATGVDHLAKKLGDAAKNSAAFLKSAAAKGAEMDRLQISIEKGEAKLILTRAKTEKQLRDLQLIANDRSLSAEKNNKAAEKAQVLASTLAASEKKVINEKIKQEEIRQSLNDSGREDLKKLNELKAQGIAADEKASATNLKFLTAKSRLEKASETKRTAAAKEALQKRTELEAAAAARHEDLIKLNLEREANANATMMELYEEDADNSKLSFDKRQDALLEFSKKKQEINDNAEAESIRQAKNKYGNDTELLNAQLAIIKQKTLEANTELANEIAEKQQKLYEDNGIKLTETAVAQVAERSRKESAALEQSYIDGTISKEEYEKAKASLADKYADERIQVEIDAAQKIIDIDKAAGIDVGDAAKRLAALQMQLSDNVRAREIKNAEESATKQADIHKRIADKRKELEKAIEKFGEQLISDSFKKRQDQLSLDLENVEYEKEQKINAINAENLTEQEARMQTARVEAQAAQKTKRIHDEQRRLKQQEARIDRAITIGKIIANTALAIMEAAPNPFLVALTAALGAVQLATVLSHPLPQFAKGTESSPEGWAVTGEQGSELMIDPRGNLTLSDNKASLTYLQKGTTIKDANRTQEILAAASLPNFSGSKKEVNYSSKFDELKKAIQNTSVEKVNFSWTERGVRKWIKKGNIERAWINSIKY